MQEVTAAQVRRMQAQAADDPGRGAASRWQQLGPYNIGGRVTDVVADRFTPNGVSRRSRAAASGTPRTAARTGPRCGPTSTTQPMGAFAQAPDGTLWAGTGEANPPGGGLTYFGDGVYKSTDNGAHWTNMGLRESAAIGRIAVDPTNPNRVFVAAAGHVARSAAQRGLYRTEDGGKTWELVLAPTNATTGAIDVAINPHEPADRLRVAVGPQAHQRRAHLRRRRLRPVPLQGRRRHVGAAARTSSTRCRPTTRRRPA